MTAKAKDNKIDAFTLFPDLFSHETRKRPQKKRAFGHIELKPVTRSSNTIVRPPLPPDISWLRNGEVSSTDDEPIDIPSALVLMQDGTLKDETVSAIKKYGYLIESVETPFEAIHRLSFSKYGIVVVHTRFEDRLSFSDSVVHSYLCNLPMSRRREMYYVVIGPELQTYYRLAALSLSANLVVNDQDIDHLGKILKKGFREYEELFGPMIDLLQSLT